MRHVPGASPRTRGATLPSRQVRRHTHQTPGPQGVNQGSRISTPTHTRRHTLTNHPHQSRVVTPLQSPSQHDGVPTGSVNVTRGILVDGVDST